MTPDQLIRAMEATWPPAATRTLGPVMLRIGQGGGKRVSAASLAGPWTTADLDAAEAAMRDLGQEPLFQLRPAETALDAELARRGYDLVDPVLGYGAPAASLARPVPPLAAFPHWPPLEITRSLWAESGVGPARIAVMERVAGAKAVLLARTKDRPSGAAFVAMAEGIAMLHALEIRPAFRRQGAAGHVIAAAAQWALEQGAATLALVVTEANAPARRLYESLGMTPVEGYHYRSLPRGQRR
jgi:GNAT superfamily N-acetyltransferase